MKKVPNSNNLRNPVIVNHSDLRITISNAAVKPDLKIHDKIMVSPKELLSKYYSYQPTSIKEIHSSRHKTPHEIRSIKIQNVTPIKQPSSKEAAPRTKQLDGLADLYRYMWETNTHLPPKKRFCLHMFYGSNINRHPNISKVNTGNWVSEEKTVLKEKKDKSSVSLSTWRTVTSSENVLNKDQIDNSHALEQECLSEDEDSHHDRDAHWQSNIVDNEPNQVLGPTQYDHLYALPTDIGYNKNNIDSERDTTDSEVEDKDFNQAETARSMLKKEMDSIDLCDTTDSESEDEGTSIIQTEMARRMLDPKMVPIGDGSVYVPRDFFKCIDWNSYTKATRLLLTAVFPRRMLATHSLTGKPAPGFPHLARKKKLPSKFIDDIVYCVAERCSVTPRQVRTIITMKCGNSSKCEKKKIKKD